MQRITVIPTGRRMNPIRGLLAPRAAARAGHVRGLTSSSSMPPKSQDQGQPAPDRDSTKSETQDGGKGRPTVADQDEALRLKMSGLSGDGGSAGVEYEDGKPVALKRGVKNNMFRYI
ncbi:hypothetical protein F4809DRAFT_236626 [Biscogniauxia mediterranea]|nr:hypothetical protein F4809DRAFT_236626 [Biscogniauxia mediterranea]